MEYTLTNILIELKFVSQHLQIVVKHMVWDSCMKDINRKSYLIFESGVVSNRSIVLAEHCWHFCQVVS